MGNAYRSRSSAGNRATGLVDSQAVKATGFYFTNDYSVYFDGTATAQIDSTNAVEDFGPVLDNQFSMSFWNKETAASRSFNFVCGAVTSDSLVNGFGAYWSGNIITIWWNQYNGTNRATYNQSNATNVGEWHHYVFSYDGSAPTNRVNLYVNGVLETTVVGSDQSYDGTTSILKIGTIGNSTSYHSTGNVDELALWNTPLTDEDVLSLYAGGDPALIDASSIQADNLMVYYRLGDDGDTDSVEGILDKSGNGNHATMGAGSSIQEDPALA